MSVIEPGFKEEITDMFKPEAISKIKVGTVFKFDYEGSITCIRVTRKTKDRLWGVHISLHDMNVTMSHYGHNIDTTVDPMWCDDCECPVNEISNSHGRAEAQKRAKEKGLSEESPKA